MRQMISVPVLALVLYGSAAFAQQKQQSDPYASPPPPPQAPSTQPNKNCSGQAVKGDKGPWKASSTCPSASDQSNSAPALQQAPDTAKPKKSTAEDNPFPEDLSEKAAAAAKARDAESAKPAAAPESGESTSRTKALDNLDLEGNRDSRIDNGAGGIVHDPKLAADDVHVGQFYLNREDYKGAYARFKEATQADPGNADAVFYLGEAARHMNHRDEAIQNYQLYLDALPNGPKAKDARKALKEMASSKH